MSVKINNYQLCASGAELTLEWSDGQQFRFHAFWLRDNALDADSRDPNNGQRLISVLDVSSEINISAVELCHSGHIKLLFMPEHKWFEFDALWLQQNAYDTGADSSYGRVAHALRLWNRDQLASVPESNYQQLRADKTQLADWLGHVHRLGVAKLTNVPTEPGSVCEVAKLFGFVRETNYGMFFDVRSEVEPINLAYTGLGLQAHTDNPYRDPVPTLQLLACLENSAEGGESIVVDGFEAVRRLRDENQEYLNILSKYPARFSFAGADGVQLHAKRPIIEVSADGRLIALRFNNRSIAPVVDVPFDQMEFYYQAYRRLAEIITDPSMEVSFKLKPGELFIVDNTRVLHSRLPFKASGAGAGYRWLQGCYADMDGLLSTLSSIRLQHSDTTVRGQA